MLRSLLLLRASAHALVAVFSLATASSLAFGQTTAKSPVFDVASVKPSERLVGPDYNNQFAFSPNGITGRNVTLKRLVAEAYRLQLNQVLGPGWLNQNEYEIEARVSAPVDKDQLRLMLRALLTERFRLKQHSETREMNVYELAPDKAGPKIRPVNDGQPAQRGAGSHFHGDLRQFADFLAVQLSVPILDDPNQPGRAGGPSVPVLDKTGLTGVYDFSIDIRPELGVDMFALWQRALSAQLGLRIDHRRGPVDVVVVEDAAKIPAAN